MVVKENEGAVAAGNSWGDTILYKKKGSGFVEDEGIKGFH